MVKKDLREQTKIYLLTGNWYCHNKVWNDKSRVTGDCHARFCESLEVKFLYSTRLYILILFLVSSLVTYQGYAIEDNTCAEALGLGKELRDFYAARG